MTQEELTEATGLSARLRYLLVKAPLFEWYERKQARNRLEELGVDPPQVTVDETPRIA